MTLEEDFQEVRMQIKRILSTSSLTSAYFPGCIITSEINLMREEFTKRGIDFTHCYTFIRLRSMNLLELELILGDLKSE